MVQESRLGSKFPDSEDRSWKYVDNKDKYERLERVQKYVKDSPSLALDRVYVPDIDDDVFKSYLRKLDFLESSVEFSVKLARKALLELSELDKNKRKGYHVGYANFGHVLQASIAHYVSKVDNIPLTLDKIVRIFGVEKKDVLRFSKEMKRLLRLPTPMREEGVYYRWIEKISSRFNLSGETQRLARDVARKIVNNGLDSGKSVPPVVGGIIYFSAIEKNEGTTQSEIAETLDISQVSVRNHYKKISEEFDGG